ncbi:MAG: class I SAM-dependent methyltransferase [Victivallaceae bacterium]|nr:class I SAM-dependent methyltransferase [Victivallaceae bacterium]
MNTRNCHICGGTLYREPILELRGMPKAAQYYPERDEFAEDKGVTLSICQCSKCGLVQHTMKPVAYFKEVITAATLSDKSRLSRLNQMKEFADRFSIQGKNVLDIGSGKGEMLDVLEEAGLKATGLEASPESVKIGRSAGRNMVNGYIGDISKLGDGLFDAFIALNYLEHLPDLGNVIGNIHKATSADAAGFVTVPNLEYLLKTNCFYEFVVDHISYFTEKTLTFAFEANGFNVLDCGLINNENDIAIVVKKKKSLDISQQYVKVETVIRDLRKIISAYKSKNKKVAVWGAGHRTLALLALSKTDDIEYIIDSAKFKQGKFAPVTHTRIVSPEMLYKEKADLVIIMVPGIYPDEVYKSVMNMNLGVDLAMLKDNRIKHLIKQTGIIK